MNNRNKLMKVGMGAVGGLILLPMLNSKFRKMIGRAGRDAFFQLSDYLQDIAEIKK